MVVISQVQSSLILMWWFTYIDFGGQSKYTYQSLNLYSNVYQEGRCVGILDNAVVPHFVDGYYNNTCVQGAKVPYVQIDICNSSNIAPFTMPILSNNRIHASDDISVSCGNTIVPEKVWQALGYDHGTAHLPLPNASTVKEWITTLLYFWSCFTKIQQYAPTNPVPGWSLLGVRSGS